jgi:hypothetical protein
MSIVLLLLFVGALFAMEYFRRSGEAFAARLVPAERTAGRQAEFAKFPLQMQREFPAAIERRHSDRRSSDRRRAA